ncbi:glutathione-disulfide reductase [Oleiagrimonas sp. C23AA]|uniref:glutathione-disulfide reductase n=1 Tax=Oleiagrimonas sp. C23AA TaxID=2719047 RepID=UPI0014205A99|nr:glutathione-disulfide reductase [Oleiagrimonas sp. C23AA]NII09323.1 glutathione-disulfide reductase [Oleiagrimonas sp. C23AA]
MSDRFDLIVLGAGSGGLAAAFRAARHGARVALLEPNQLGGTCVNVGCVPKKAMWHAAQMAEAQQLAVDYGFDVTPGPLDWSAFVKRRQAYIANIHASYHRRLAEADIEVIASRGRLLGQGRVKAGERTLQAPHIVLATGAHPKRLDVPGFDLGMVSDDFFDLDACPGKVAIVGGGYISVELAGVMHTLGAQVDIYARGHLMHGFDAEMALALGECMRAQGIDIHYQCQVSKLMREGDQLFMNCTAGNRLGPYDKVLWAVGRVPNSDNIGLEKAGVACDDQGHVLIDTFQNTEAHGIYAIGDVTDRLALTPVAIAAGRRLADRLFGGRRQAHLDYQNIPSVVFAHPPLAGCGMAEEDARSVHGEAVKVYRSRFTPMHLSLSDHGYQSVFKLVCVGEDERVVGVHALGAGAEELIQGFAVAVKMGARKVDLDDTVAVHPTSAEEMVLMR